MGYGIGNRQDISIYDYLCMPIQIFGKMHAIFQPVYGAVKSTESVLCLEFSPFEL